MKGKPMPLQLRGGTSFGPVALICATICFLASGAMLLYLITHYPDQAEVYIRPLIPSLVTLGAALVLWLRSQKGSRENEHISHQVAKAAEAADQAAVAVDKGLNGTLDEKLRTMKAEIVRELKTEMRKIKEN